MQTDMLRKKNGNKYLIFDSTDENKELNYKYNRIDLSEKIDVNKTNL